METVVERPAALDVHEEQVTACVRVPAGLLPVYSLAGQGLVALACVRTPSAIH